MKNEFKKALYGLLLLSIFATASSGCAKDDDPETPADPTTVTDVDGNVYHTVTIGTQVWMVENLKTTKYRDGTPIPEILDDVLWRSTNEGACCSYNLDVANSAKYGRLYNWFAAKATNNLAPAGWHVPSDAEWTTLIAYLGGYNAGTKMKAVDEWNGTFGNYYATNESGFTALPAGQRVPNYALSYTRFEYLGDMCTWWSSTEGSMSGYGNRSGASSSQPGINQTQSDKRCGFSVRCIKD